jgi:signal transduction histidine kinase/ActR/RegA family two-component response regulator
MDKTRTVVDERVLILIPSERDIDRTISLLGEADVVCAACSSMVELCREQLLGAGAVLITDEALAADRERRLEHALRQQPRWSALPVLLLTRDGSSERSQHRSLGGYNHVVVVERPVRTRSLISAVRSALRARRGQYEIRDAILERERQSQKLSAQDEKLRFALAAGRLGSWELDLQTEQYDCSDICKANYGRPVELPFTYEELTQSIHPADRSRVRAAMQESLESRSPYDVEYRVFWPNGEQHWLLVRGRAVYDTLGRATRIAGVSLDVTERERLHEALLRSQAELAAQAEQLRTADRLKDEFLATLAHELRNPLAPIRTGLTLLCESTDPQLSRKALDVMQRQVRHMVRLIDDLLDVSRITQGKLELKRQRISVASAVEAAIESSLPAIERARHRLHTVPSAEPLFVDADPTRLAQIIGNLLNNAAKYTPNQGNIELRVEREGESVLLSVRDNGLGLPQECLGDVFEMFNQVDQSLHRAQGGLGIGLALVRKLVQMHGGSVSAESAGLGQGSTFSVRLPLASAESAVVPQPSSTSTNQPQRELILVVDDNDDAADLLTLMLKQAGYETSAAADGPAALDAARRLHPQVIILDIGLPGMTGYEVAQELRRDAGLADTSLIALTGWGAPEDQRKARAAGFDLHLTKPVAFEELRSALRRVKALRPSSGEAPQQA